MEREVPLLQDKEKWGWRVVFEEAKQAISIALPMIVVTIVQYLGPPAALFMLGHLDELSLASASIATSLCNATGFTVLFGMASALETLCGQAYGAGQYHRLAALTCASVLSLFLVSILISILWIYAEGLLILMGQDPEISAGAGRYAAMLIPALFGSAALQSLVRFFQTQRLMLPLFCMSLASLCIQLPICWVFVFKLNLGNGGAASSIAISAWLNVVCLLVYAKYSSNCRRTLVPFSKHDVLAAMKDFLPIAAPSAVMYCLEGWTFELVILLSGLLPNPQLETSVLTMCYMIGGLHSYIPYSLGAAASTMVSNELGAGKPWAARLAVYVVLMISVVEFLLASLIVYLCRGAIGYAFSNEKEIIDTIEKMAPLICICIVVDSLQGVYSGVVRGSGWQQIGAYVNLGAYYLVGVPIAVVLGFVAQLKGKGLFWGLIAGAAVQALAFSVITALIDWEKKAMETRERILGDDGNLQEVLRIEA